MCSWNHLLIHNKIIIVFAASRTTFQIQEDKKLLGMEVVLLTVRVVGMIGVDATDDCQTIKLEDF